MNRNRFKNDQGTLWMTIPVWKKGLGFQRIDQVRICREGRWIGKHFTSLQSAYAKAPFFRDHLGFLEGIFSDMPEMLLDLNLRIIRYLNAQLDIGARMVLLSELQIEAKEPQLSLEICRTLGASRFLALNSVRRHLPEETFLQAGVTLTFLNPRPCEYPQLWGGFIGNLSALDLLFNCGPGAPRVLEMGLPKDISG